VTESALQKARTKRDKAGEKYKRLAAKADAARRRFLKHCNRVAAMGGDVPPDYHTLAAIAPAKPMTVPLEVPQYARMQARIARELGITRGQVSRVARGERRSPRIEAALKAEQQRLDDLVTDRNGECKAECAA